MNSVFDFLSWDHPSSSFYGILLILGVAAIMLLLYDWWKKNSQPHVGIRVLPKQFRDSAINGAIGDYDEVYFCPQCFSISHSPGNCQNEEHCTEVRLEQGSSEQLEYYMQMQELVDPDNDTPGYL